MLIIVVCVVALCASASMGLTRMGAPAGTIGGGKWDVGIDYTYARQNMDWTGAQSSTNGAAYVNVASDSRDGTIKNMKVQTADVRLGYGLMDKWDIYGLLGATKTKTDNVGVSDSDFSSSTEPMVGIGTKATFWQDGALSLGALAGVGWVDGLKDSVTNDGFKTDVRANIMESQIAVGPTYQITDGVSVYGGPFAHFAQGDIKVKVTRLSNGNNERLRADLEQSSWCGAYIGTELAVTKDISANIEYQHTAFADAGGINVTFKF